MLKKRLISAIVMQVQSEPAKCDREARDRPIGIAPVTREAMTERVAESQARGVVEHVVEIDSVEAGCSSESSHLAINVVEPKGEMEQSDSRNEPRMRSRTDRDGGDDTRDQGHRSHLIRREAEAHRQPGSVNGQGAIQPPRQDVPDLAMTRLMPFRPDLVECRTLPHQGLPRPVRE